MALTQNSTILISDISSALSGKQDKLAYVPVKSVNGTSADASGNVTVSAEVQGQIGSAIASNSSSLTVPSGGTWFCWNTGFYASPDGGASMQSGVSTKSGNTSSGYQSYGGTFSGGTKVYAKCRLLNNYSDDGKVAAIRIS